MYQKITTIAIVILLSLFQKTFAQTMIPLPSHSSVYSGQARGFWFTAPCNMTITGVRVPADAGTSGDQYIQIMNVLDNPPVVYGTMSTNFTNLAYIAGATNGVIQSVSIPVTTGQIIGIIGTVGSGSNNSYSATSPYSSTINGYSVSLGRFITQQTNGIYSAATPDYSTENTGSIGRVEVYYSVCDKPTGLNASGITSNSANLSWTAVTGSVGYEYIVDQLSTAPTGAGTATTATSATALSLASNTNYYLHVRNKCDATTFSLWETVPFTTLVNPCGFPTGITYNTPTASSADFHWRPEAGSMGYEYMLSATPASPTVPGTSTVDTFANFSGLTGGQGYYFHVRNKCTSTGGTWSDWNTQQFLMPECKMPTNILFSAVKDTSIDLIWSMMPAANMYQYQVDLSPNDPASGSGYSTTTSITAHVGGLLSNTKYYAHIRSVCFVSDYSTWALDSFVTQYACNPPILVLNNPGAANLTVSWTSVDDAVAYEYKISSSTTPPSFGNATTTNTTFTTTLPADGRNYYAHVRTKCNSQYEFSGWSTLALRETPTGITLLEDDVFAVNVFPNPAKDAITIETSGQMGEDATVQITDPTGRVVLQQNIDEVKTQLNIAQLAPGIYLVKYSDKQNTKVMKIQKQ